MLFISAINTEILLILSFVLLFLSSKTKKKRIGFYSIFFLLGSIPLVYIFIDDVRNDYQDANIGLGLAFFYTWLYSAVVFVISIINFIKNKRKT